MLIFITSPAGQFVPAGTRRRASRFVSAKCSSATQSFRFRAIATLLLAARTWAPMSHWRRRCLVVIALDRALLARQLAPPLWTGLLYSLGGGISEEVVFH